MIATYNPTREGMTLNVRKAPDPDAEKVGSIGGGETVAVSKVERGWCETPSGYIDARFVIVEEGEAPEEKPAEPPKTEDAPKEPTEPETVEEGEAPDPDAEARERFGEMTNDELLDLAEQSGIKVNKKARKDEIIDAILAGMNG